MKRAVMILQFNTMNTSDMIELKAAEERESQQKRKELLVIL